MKRYFVVSLSGHLSVVGPTAEEPEGLFVREVVGDESTLELRYEFNGSELVDKYVGKTDKEVHDAIIEAAAQAVTANAITKVSPVEFKLLFTPQERIAIKAIRATDAVIDDFYDIAEDPRLTHVDLSLSTTQQAIGYMVTLNLLTQERATQILSGVAP